MKMTRSAAGVLTMIALGVGGGPSTAQAQSPAGVIATVGEEFALAFLRHRSSSSWARIEVSRTGRDGPWTDTAFPDLLNGQIRMRDIAGVGLCGSRDRKTLTVVFNQRSSTSYSVTGTVDANGLAWGTWTMLEAAPGATAPSCAIPDNGMTLVGLKTGGSAHVNLYARPAGGVAVLVATAIPSQFNGNASAPTVAVAGSRVVMAWKYWQGTCAKVAVAQGDITQSGTVFNLTMPVVVSLSMTGGGTMHACTTADPVIASDDKHFFVGVVQEGRGSPLHAWHQVVYQTPALDVRDAWVEGGRAPLNVHNRTYLGIAAKEGGDVAVAKVRDKQGANDVGAAVRSGTAWQDWGKAPWVNGADASYKAFGFARLGSNEPYSIRPGEAESIRERGATLQPARP